MPVIPEETNEDVFSEKVTKGLAGVRSEAADEFGLRAFQRGEEMRDLHVLEAYSALEEGLRNLLHSPDQGVLGLSDREAQGCTRRVAEYFDTEGEKILADLPDDECKERFADVMGSRRKVAMRTAARHESQEFFKWKERTAQRTVDEVIKSAAADPDPMFLEHGAQFIEGTINRLYRGDSVEVLKRRCLAAVQEMYRGALESIGGNNPLRALSLLEFWKVNFDEETYEELKDSFSPGALRQKVRYEYEDLRFMPPEEARKLIDEIKDEELHAELSAMVGSGMVLREAETAKAEKRELDEVCRQLFEKMEKSELTPDDVLYSALPQNERLLWLAALERSVRPSSDVLFLEMVEAITDGKVESVHEIFLACAGGLSTEKARSCEYLLGLRDRADWRALVNCLAMLAQACKGYDTKPDVSAAVCNDFLSRFKDLEQEGKKLEFGKIVREVIADHFAFVPSQEEQQPRDDEWQLP